MNLNWPASLSIFGVPLLMGAGTLLAIGIRPRDDGWGWPGWCWVVGTLVFSLVLFLGLLLGVPLSPWPFATCGFVLGAAGLAFGWRRKVNTPASAPRESYRGAAFGRILMGAAVLFCVVLTLARAGGANSRPIIAGDELHIWAAKAKTIWISGGFTEDFRSRSRRGGDVAHADYPLQNPMMQLWVFIVAGEVTHVENRLPIQMYMIALILILAGVMQRHAPGWIGAPLLLLTIGCTRSNFLTQFAYADHMVALGLLMGVDGWQRVEEGEDRRFLHLSTLGLAFAVWSKNESQLLLGVFFAAWITFTLVRRPADVRSTHLWRKLVRAFGAPGLIFLVHTLHKNHYGWRNDLTGGWGGEPLWVLFFRQFADRFGIVSEAFLSLFLWHPLTPVPWSTERGFCFFRLVDNNNLFLLTFLVWLFFPRRSVSGPRLFPALVITFGLFGFFAVYIGSFQQINWHLQTSLDRVLYDLVPLCAAFSSAALGQVIGRRPPILVPEGNT